jgi:predicted nuclease with RNAse H fold
MRALGIDVSVTRGLDAVLLDGDRRVLEVISSLATSDLLETARRMRPDGVFIDSPASWAQRGRSRLAERVLAKAGITAYATPMDPGDHPFYRWMSAGFAAYAAVADDFPVYRGGRVAGHAAEVFPHASAVLLAGRLSGGIAKRAFRLSVLQEAGVDAAELRTQDRIDAALAALTGILALTNQGTSIGDPVDGFLVLPVKALPLRLTVEGGPARLPRRPSVSSSEGRLVSSSGFCLCGCGESIGARARFRPGHDARYRSRLTLAMRQGEAARHELERLGWLPAQSFSGDRHETKEPPGGSDT